MNVQNLSKNEFKIYLEAKKRNKKVLAIDDLIDMLHESKSQAYHQLYKMNKKGLIKRLKNGLYVIYPDHLLFNVQYYVEDPIQVLKQLSEPYFVSHYTALDLYGLSQRSLNILYFTTTKNVKPLNQETYLIKPVIVRQKYFFGYIQINLENDLINVSDLERTILDIINRPDLAHGFEDVIKSILGIDQEINYSKLLDYLSKFNKKVLFQRIGYLFDTPAIKRQLNVPDDFLNKLKAINYSINYFGFSREKGIYNKQWKLIVPTRIHSIFNDY
ncbi:MAG: hypothetical protein EU536_04480 [Promethearchaeota archaeon]|nr:MAG: hypothetical protein EU536_04480 [Candidatus Lokiarchaeota archaeon]